MSEAISSGAREAGTTIFEPSASARKSVFRPPMWSKSRKRRIARGRSARFGGNAAAAVADAADDGRVYPGSGGEAPAGNAELLERLPEQVSGMRNFKFGLSCGHGGENFQFQW